MTQKAGNKLSSSARFPEGELKTQVIRAGLTLGWGGTRTKVGCKLSAETRVSKEWSVS